MHNPDQDQLEQFLDDLATPFLRYIQTKTALLELTHADPPASLTRWANAIERASTQMRAVRIVIMDYAQSQITPDAGLPPLDEVDHRGTQLDASSVEFAPES